MSNFSYLWNVCNDDYFPVLSAVHYVAGISYNGKYMKFSTEGFYKTTDNIGMFIPFREIKGLKFNIGESKAAGIDLYFKTKIGKHEFWTSYTLSRIIERFSDSYSEQQFKLSTHNQTHEIRSAAIFNFSPFYISANYIYGSGLEFTSYFEDRDMPIPYNRMDLAVLYKLKIKKIKAEIGLSVLNVFNTQNIRYDSFSQFPNGRVFYSGATPFTPMINLKLGF